jgi:polysaccharide export outer membrane protein
MLTERAKRTSCGFISFAPVIIRYGDPEPGWGRGFMQHMRRSALFIVFAACISMSACGGADVVKVTTVRDSRLEGIGEAERAKIEEIKKSGQTQQGIDDGLSNVIEATRHFSVPEYLVQHPGARGAVGGDYTVGGYDVLSITVYEEKDLSKEAVRVSEDGYISFPLIGRIKVDDLTTSEIEQTISHKLAEEEYLLDAHVAVLVTEYNSKRFLVLGAVKTPGSYSLQASECVLDAISRAGGIDSEHAGKRAMIVRTEDLKGAQERKVVIDIDLQGLLKGQDQISNMYLSDKDVLFIPTAEHFYIIGQVNKPASYTLPEGEITLVEAIGMAGGFTRIAARNRTRIIRVENGAEKIIEVQVDAITEAGRKIQDVVIRPNDVIVVPESFF